MRSNGLTAATYTPVADLSPQLADALLDDLKRRGVAAYTKPVESSSAAGFDRPEFRVDVKDRLFVASNSADEVRQLLHELGVDDDDPNDDLAWEQIVAGFDRPLDTVGTWPANEDVGPEDVLVDERDAAAQQATDERDDDTAPRLRWGSRRDRAPSDDEDFLAVTMPARDDDHEERPDPLDEVERFVPPTPPPLPRLETHQKLAWAGLIGGPLLLLAAALFSLPLPGWVIVFAVLAFIGGFVTLIATMDSDGDDWDPDNGAVV
jgi:hypothetical protein